MCQFQPILTVNLTGFRWNAPDECLIEIVIEIMVIDHTKIFSTEATLAKCHNCLSSFGVPASSTNRKTRMMNLTSSWDSSRKKLFEAVLAFKSLPLPIAATFVLEGRCKYDVQRAQ